MGYTGRFKKKRLTATEKRLDSILCPDCGDKTRVVPAGTVYRRYIPSKIREVLVCSNYPACDCYVSVNIKRHQYGIPANYEVRQLRRKAHELQSELISQKIMTREDVYLLHKRIFRKSPSRCHIRYFDKQMCLKTIQYYQRVLRYSRQKAA